MLSFVRAAASRLRTRPLLGRLALGLVPDWRRTVHLDGIGPFAIHLRRNRSYWLRDPLAVEHFPFSMLTALVEPGDVIYDAGANLGLYSRFLVSRLDAGRVYAFEPMADNRAMLERNLALGGVAERVTVLPYALADSDGEAKFQIDDRQTSSGTLDRVSGGQPSEGRRNLGLGPLTTRVPVRRLDTLVNDEDLPPPAVIKVDVEGAEALLLEGAQEVLRRHAPKLFVELHGAGEAAAVLALLDRLGYCCKGKVGEWVDPHGYVSVDPSWIPRLTGPYDLTFVVSARDTSDLPATYDPDAPL